MSNHRCDKPVPINQCCIRIVISEYRIGNPCPPYAAFISLPVLYRFCTRNDRRLLHLGTINDSGILSSPIYRADCLPINPRCNNDLVARLCARSRLLYPPERTFSAPVTLLRCIYIYIIFHPHPLHPSSFIKSILPFSQNAKRFLPSRSL